MRSWTLTLAVLALAGCTTIPEELQGIYPPVSPLRVEAAEFGSAVRWGGVIIDSTHSRADTCFEILSRDLDKYLRPRVEDRSGGRFIACKEGFYDPEVFARGREVTLVGRIRALEVRNVDEFEYHYPVVDVEELVLWEVREEVLVVDNHFYSPFWHPYYWHGPYWGYYPYYRPGWPMHGRSYVRTRQFLPDPADLPERH
jgi:outer membrane lipoprotein